MEKENIFCGGKKRRRKRRKKYHGERKIVAGRVEGKLECGRKTKALIRSHCGPKKSDLRGVRVQTFLT